MFLVQSLYQCEAEPLFHQWARNWGLAEHSTTHSRENERHLQNYKYKFIILVLHLGLWLQSGVDGLPEQRFITHFHYIHITYFFHF